MVIFNDYTLVVKFIIVNNNTLLHNNQFKRIIVTSILIPAACNNGFNQLVNQYNNEMIGIPVIEEQLYLLVSDNNLTHILVHSVITVMNTQISVITVKWFLRRYFLA